jgi:hypothetical protein
VTGPYLVTAKAPPGPILRASWAMTHRPAATLDEAGDLVEEYVTTAAGGTDIVVEPIHDGVFGLRDFARPVLGDQVDSLGIAEIIAAYDEAQTGGRR